MTRQEALALRQLIEQAAQGLTDDAALKGIRLHPVWEAGVVYDEGYRVRYDGRLFKAVQAHTAQVGWEPAAAAALWTEVCESHSGAMTDPIPYEGNMALTAGLYYSQSGKVYRCVRDTVNPVYNSLAELVGLYVEEV